MPSGPPQPPFSQLPPQHRVVVEMIGQGVLQYFLTYFPTGIADPNIPLQVQRRTSNGPIMQQTTFAQLIAENTDTMKMLINSIDDLSDLTEEALDETKARKTRRRSRV
jgi:hypothetical protein